jgi:hypothetical protein
VASATQVRLALHDAQGREVAVLANGEQEPGSYTLVWDGAGPAGPLPAGIYFMRYSGPSFTTSKRVAITR